MDDAERANTQKAGRPELVKGNQQLLLVGMGRLTESSILNIKNKSFALTARVDVPETGADGVTVAQSGATGDCAGSPSTLPAATAPVRHRDRQSRRRGGGCWLLRGPDAEQQWR